MLSQCTISDNTRRNWFVDVLLLISTLLTSVSGLYFLFMPHGGFRGGRNAITNTFLGLSRSVWRDIHIYAGLAMIAIAVYHVVIHWDWIKCTFRRIWKMMRGVNNGGNGSGWTNVFVNLVVTIAFIISAVSGLYFYLVPHGGPGIGQGEQSVFLFSRQVWNWLHEWIGLAFIVLFIVHFILHWDWVVRITRKMLGVSPVVNSISSGVPE